MKNNFWRLYAVVKKEKRGTALVEYDFGILVVSRNKMGPYSLPGGHVEKNEPVICTAIRELSDETTLKAISATYLFKHTSSKREHHVIKIDANGVAHPKKEIRFVAYYTLESDIKLSKSAKNIISKYYVVK